MPTLVVTCINTHVLFVLVIIALFCYIIRKWNQFVTFALLT